MKRKNRSSFFGSFPLLKATKKYLARKRKSGFTMIEVLIVLSIIGIFSTAGVIGFQTSQAKARDAQRKGDLAKIKVAFEDYYNDNSCYPDSSVLANCGQPFSSYLNSIPCDPITGEAYKYVPNTNSCTGYRLYAALENTTDPIIGQLGCDGPNGCGYGATYNYGVSAGVAVNDTTAPGAAQGGGSTPSPSPSGSTGPIYVYACDNSGVCNQFAAGSPFLLNCPVTYQQTNCNNECGNPALRCN